MAKTVPATPPKEDAIATKPKTPTAMAERPTYVEASREGLENMHKEDVLIPRLALAQANTPQVTEGDPKYVEGMRPGDLFNSLTSQNYGRNVIVQILHKDSPRAMEFNPMDDGGGVKDPNVPLNDPRTKWGANGEKPAATVFRDYFARIFPGEGADFPGGEMIALSFKSSGIKVAKELNGLINMRNAPIYAGLYRITTDTKLTPKPHKIFVVENAGWASEEDYQIGKAMHAAVKDLDPGTVDRDAGYNPDTDFAPDGTVRTVEKDADVPF